MSQKRYFWLVCFLAMLFSVPVFAAVKTLNEAGYGVSGVMDILQTSSTDDSSSHTSTFNIDEDGEGTGDDQQIATPLPKRLSAPLRGAKGEDSPQQGSDPNNAGYCKLTKDLVYTAYDNIFEIDEDGKTEKRYCTCEYFIDDLTEAQALCTAQVADEGARANNPAPCYYTTSSCPIQGGDETETFGMTYVGCDCAGYTTYEDYCRNNIVLRFKNDAAIRGCINSMEAHETCHTRLYEDPNNEGNYLIGKMDEVRYEGFACKEGYVTKSEYWNINKDKNEDKITIDGKTIGIDEYNDFYVGLGAPCIADANGNESEYKYKYFGLRCTGTVLGEGETVYEKCYVNSSFEPNSMNCYQQDVTTGLYAGVDGTDEPSIQCTCPESFKMECGKSYESVGGVSCAFDHDATGVEITKYSECKITCESDFAAAYADSASGCNNNKIDGYGGAIRQYNNRYETCSVADDPLGVYYICACPEGFYTKEEWCKTNAESAGVTQKECMKSFVGKGTACYRDVERDESGSPSTVLTKYTSYHRACPNDRPLYYSEEDCGYVGGVFEYSCYDGTLNTRFVCSCDTEFYDAEGNRKEGDACTVQNLASQGSSPRSLTAEASGEYCSLDSETDLKYEQCVVTCEAFLNEFAIDNAYMYLDSKDSTPTPVLCQKEMGTGALLGYVDNDTTLNQPYCSLNHELKYPCYCPKDFTECNENNEFPDPDAKLCTANGKVYYDKCTYKECEPESETLFLENVQSTDNDNNPITYAVDYYIGLYGKGAKVEFCVQTQEDGTKVDKYQISCDPAVYDSPCDYPYISPLDPGPDTDATLAEIKKYNPGYDKTFTDYCIYKDAKGEKREHYKSARCYIRRTLGACGESILESDGSEHHADDNLVIYTASTEEECKQKFGNGIQTQLCEYESNNGADNVKRHYNCYFNKNQYSFTTANCGVRHDLSGEYVVMNGVKHWDSCECVATYQHHKYNCPGMLNGTPCKQTINSRTLKNDEVIKDLVSLGSLKKGDSLQMYPYCQCSSDYTKVCDEDGSGRYKGVGEACNGKYKACECVPDELPPHWSESYYGCDDGKRPTGVWKDNGCGKKYYQCHSAINPCTYEYTEKCEDPLKGVGEPCQDNQGIIGGYKSCVCPSGYKICPNGKVGKGEPCNLKGVSWYKDCVDIGTCSAVATNTCKEPLLIGVNPCTRDNETFYEKCVCANGYNKLCGEGEVGIGNYCELDGKKYYKECVKPTDTTCTPKHEETCDAHQESYSPCVDTNPSTGKQTVKYLCRCPTNWQTCSAGKNPAEYCTDTTGTTYYRECSDAGEAACTSYQKIHYKDCTDAQTGIGNSCYVEEGGLTKIKYAECRDSNSCIGNGFKYSCSGYNAEDQGDYCVDSNGNKLYKSCACPKSYGECNTTNATKGKPCKALNEDGTESDAVYSSCTCDRSRYKYTCKAEGYNLGITVPEKPTYCAVKEKTTSTDDEGNQTTSEEEAKYYNYCRCREEYKYTCSNTDYGETVVDAYKTDYCMLNATKFYVGCECGTKFKYTSDADCQEEYAGAADPTCYVVDTTSAFCNRKGISSMEHGEDGSLTSIEYFNEEEILYSKCKYDANACVGGTDGEGEDEGGDSGDEGGDSGDDSGGNGNNSGGNSTTVYASCTEYATTNNNNYSVPEENVVESVCSKDDATKYQNVNINNSTVKCFLRECMPLV